jgi:hypothetical protein
VQLDRKVHKVLLEQMVHLELLVLMAALDLKVHKVLLEQAVLRVLQVEMEQTVLQV